MMETQALPAQESLSPNHEDEDIAVVGRALAHPARLRILRLLLDQGPLSGGDIVAAIGLAQSTVSEHLRLLKEAGLVAGVPKRPRVLYMLTPAGLDPIAAFLLDLLEGASPDDPPSPAL